MVTMNKRFGGTLSPSVVEANPVLFVDDELGNRVVFSQAFRGCFAVLCAGSGEEALQIMARQRIGVLITDHRMEGMSGLDLCEEVRDRFPTVPRFLVTGFSDRDTAIEAINRGGVSRYFAKPWNLTELGAVIESTIRQLDLRSQLGALEQAVLDRERELSRAAIHTEVLHDVASINTAVIGCCSGLESILGHSGLSIPPEIRHGLQTEIAELRTAVDIIAALHARTRSQTQVAECMPDRVNLLGVITAAVGMVRARGLHGARVKIDCSEEVSVFADRIDLSRILVNLLSNAVEVLDTVDREDGHVRVCVNVYVNSVIIDVSDDGPGVEPSLREILFERLQTGHAAARGRGLGLYVCRQLAEANGGSIELNTTSAEGTTFRLTLPTTHRTDH